jgi:hypothetical protein
MTKLKRVIGIIAAISASIAVPAHGAIIEYIAVKNHIFLGTEPSGGKDSLYPFPAEDFFDYDYLEQNVIAKTNESTSTASVSYDPRTQEVSFTAWEYHPDPPTDIHEWDAVTVQWYHWTEGTGWSVFGDKIITKGSYNSYYQTRSAVVSNITEPSTIGLLLFGLVGFFGAAAKWRWITFS